LTYHSGGYRWQSSVDRRVRGREIALKFHPLVATIIYRENPITQPLDRTPTRDSVRDRVILGKLQPPVRLAFLTLGLNKSASHGVSKKVIQRI
jgi:hypothetical protein